MKKMIYTALCMALMCAMVLGNQVNVHALTQDTDRSRPVGNNIDIEVNGTRSTIGDTAVLKMINQYRYRACREHEINPDDQTTTLSLKTDYGENPTDTQLTESNGDYKPVNWSAELEHEAELRATEASIFSSHTRPSYLGSVLFDGKSYTHYECLAWTGGTMADGISGFESERNDWIKQNTSQETGHYTAMIRPSNTYAGASSFTYGPDLNNQSGYLTTALEIGPDRGYDYHTTPRNMSGTMTQRVEVSSYVVYNFGFKCADSMHPNTTMNMQPYATISDQNGSKSTWPVVPNMIWTSTDENVFTIDGQGNITSKNQLGDAEVQCYALGKVYRKAILVDHSWDEGTLTKKAGCKQEGVYTFKCKNCGATKDVAIPVHPDVHLNVTVIHKKTPSGDQPGYTGDAYCNDCHKIVKKGVYYKKIAAVSKTKTKTNTKGQTKKVKKAKIAVKSMKVKFSGKKNKVTLSWKKYKGASSYTIYRNGKKYKTTKKLKYTIKGLKKGKTYRFYVCAYKAKKKLVKSQTIQYKVPKAK